MEFSAYPIKTKPIFIDLIWGGRKLDRYVKLPKHRKTAEIWFMAQSEKYNSVVSNGPYKGFEIGQLVQKFGTKMLGPKAVRKNGKIFPLLFKFLDLEDNTSVQVHPDDTYAKKTKRSFGKTEMWYILESFERSFLYLGLKKKYPLKKFAEKIRNNTIEKELIKYNTKKGESYFVPAGTMHALGKGNVVFEIQQNSDVTFRLYDWGRLRNGKTRELHIEEGVKNIRSKAGGGKISSKFQKLSNGVSIRELVNCRQFAVAETFAKRSYSFFSRVKKPFVMTVVSGYCTVLTKDNKRFKISRGENVFFPYEMRDYMIKVSPETRFFTTEIK